MSALEATDIQYRYGGFAALNGVTVCLGENSIHGLIGPNGAGKSTFVDVLTGRKRPSAGRVLLRGEDVTRMSVRKHRVAGLSRSFQRTSIFPNLEVGEQLKYFGRHLGEKNIDEIASTVGLTPFLRREAGSISYGDQRRLDIALALLGKPSVLLLDEPMAGLSKDDSRVIANHLKDIGENRGVSILLVEHDIDIVMEICAAVTVLDMGECIASGPTKDVLQRQDVIDAYVGSRSSL